MLSCHSIRSATVVQGIDNYWLLRQQGWVEQKNLNDSIRLADQKSQFGAKI